MKTRTGKMEMSLTPMACNDKATSIAKNRMEWRSSMQHAGEQTFMRFSTAMSLQTFIHTAPSGINSDASRAIAANNQHWRMNA